MKHIELRKLVVSGEGKADAYLEFKQGLNIISGDSDTGKTYAFQCLNYVLGADTLPKKIKEAEGYNIVKLEFEVEGDLYILERVFGNSKIDIVHQEDRKTLQCKHDATNVNNLSRFLLEILLEDDELIQLNKNGKNEKRTLSFRDIMHLCSVDENKIIAEESHFQSTQYTEQTVRKSIFKYIITGEDDRNSKKQENNKEENQQRTGVVKFLEKKKDVLIKKIECIENDNNYKTFSSVSSIQESMEEINSIRAAIADLNSNIFENEVQLQEFEKQSFQDEISVSEFEKLLEYYLSEEKKNETVSNYADFLLQVPKISCPVCHQSMNDKLLSETDEDKLFKYFTKNNVQLKQKISELKITIEDIKNRISQRKDSIDNLKENNIQSAQIINEKQEILQTMNKNISLIRHLDTTRKTLEIYKLELASVMEDIVAYSEKRKSVKTLAKSVDSGIYNSYCSHISIVLERWGFTKPIEVKFDEMNLDIIINQKERIAWGKGYRAFLMSAMVISLMRYCYDNNCIHPGFTILDSPLVSLKERKKDTNGQWIEDYMEKKMIMDIAEEDCFHQVIIFENKNINYNLDCNYIEFRHDGNGRSGFIPK